MTSVLNCMTLSKVSIIAQTSYPLSAQLRTTVPLNYDLRTFGTRSYDLTVSVNDTEHVDFIEVAVLVLDINDNDPEFSNETYR